MSKIDKLEFWRWAYSDLLANTTRGILAEYIVAQAIDCKTDNRVEWDAWDLETVSGLKVEVKSSAYLQTWEQVKLSTITFDIAQRTNKRHADVYVFSIFNETDAKKADPTDLSQWSFVVCSTQLLDASFGEQKTVRLSSLKSIGVKEIPFSKLGNAIAGSQ